MKKLLSALALFLVTALPALATTVSIDSIPTVGDGSRVLSSQADEEGNWVLEIVESDVLKTFMLNDSEREDFMALEKTAESALNLAMKQDLQLRGVPIGEIRQLQGYYGWHVLSLEMDLISDKDEIKPIYRLKFHSFDNGRSTLAATLDQDGLNRLFRSGEKVEDQARLLAGIEKK